MKNHIKSILGVSSFAILVASMPQIAAAQDTDKTSAKEEVVIVTGSSIKRKMLDNALPIQIITQEDLKRDSISSPEQLISMLNSNGNGLDNLASNADVVSGAARGNNGASSANLRGQGAGATLILLNGRRVAAHGLNGGAVDINQIPLAAIQRVDVLKDGASAIYGTDAIGGVINFITKKNVTGITLNTFTDVTEDGGGNIYKGSITAGWGDLAEDNFNIMGTYSYSKNEILSGYDRNFVNTFQPNRGLSPETRGTPFASIIPLTGTFLTTTNAPIVVAPSTRATFAINVLSLPGNLGCNAIEGMDDYDELLWTSSAASAAQRKYACAYDTGKSLVLQQPLETKSYFGRGVYRFGEHELSVEITGSDADAKKRFSENQLTSNTSTAQFYYPLNSLTKTTYDRVYNDLVTAFPSLSTQYGQNLALRWRCMECGPREIETFTKTSRYLIGLDGPLGADWNYRFGISEAKSESHSELGGGFYYSYDTVDNKCDGSMTGMFCVLRSGIMNMFLLPGETQSQAALDALAKTSAKGITLYGGEYTVKEVDGSVSGPLFDLPGGKSYAALGFDLREESYGLNGDARLAGEARAIYNAPFDNTWALAKKSRYVNSIFAELDLPLFKGFDLTLAGRFDDYQGFGTTTNPKVSFKYRPIQQVMLRGSYNTGFRVPSFKQVFDAAIESPYTGGTFADPSTCPGGKSSAATGCESITFNYLSGGKLDLGPEESEQWTYGFVIEPTNNYSLSVDYWHIDTTGTITIPTLDDLFTNYSLFQDNFIRDETGKIVQVDQRYVNGGERITDGIEISFRGRHEVYGGNMTFGFDGTKLLKKEEKSLPQLPMTDYLGRWSLAGDLGLEWKHTLFVGYSKGNWSGTFTQIYRSGYIDQYTPIAGLVSGQAIAPDWKAKTDAYIIYNASLTYSGFDNFKITGGIKNLFNQDPPFALSYDNNLGSGSSWEPRVADPRGRSYTLALEYKF